MPFCLQCLMILYLMCVEHWEGHVFMVHDFYSSFYCVNYMYIFVLYTECPNGHPYLVSEVRLFFILKHELIVLYILVW